MYEGLVCICCMSTDNLVELFTVKTSSGVKWSYADKIDSCFDVQLTPTEGEDSICGCCIQKLDEAISFKRQILKTVSLLTSVSIKSLVSDPQHMEVLGIHQQKTDVEDTTIKNEIKTEDDAADSDDQSSEEDDLHECSNNADESDYNDEDTDQSDESTVKSQPKKKRKARGRPRKYPKIKMPYKISPTDTKCKECYLEFPNNLILKAHYNKHFPNFSCDKCSKSFMTPFSLKKHEMTHLAGPFPCEICQQEFNSINSLKSHKRFKHTSRPAYPCTVKQCAERFSTLSLKLKHMTQAHGLQNAYKCDECGNSFRSSMERSKHVMNKHNIKIYSCPLCDYKSKKEFIKDHLANKHAVGEKRYQCELCPSSFCKRWTLITHQRRHTDERKFKCKLCCKGFIQKCTLKYHVTTHTKKGEYLGDPASLMVEADPANQDDDQLEFMDESFLSDSEVEDYVPEKAPEWVFNEESIENPGFTVELLEELNSDGLIEDNSDLDLKENFLESFVS